MNRCLLSSLLLAAAIFAAHGQDDDIGEGAEDHIREELGVNEITAPDIQKLLLDLDGFRPLPIEIVQGNDRQAAFPNRFQTGMHFGALVADGFVIVIAQRPQDIQDIGRALIRQSQSLGVGASLLTRAKSLVDLGEAGNWMALREELIATQADIEASMMALRDEEMAHVISFGGWLRGFQLASNSTAENYTPARAEGLRRPDVMTYFIDRLETLNPRLKRTELVTQITAQMKILLSITEGITGRPPSQSEVEQMRDLANQMEGLAMAKVDDAGNLLNASE
ncbi:MAG: hypothetical protein WA771_05360 [Chthoniobacterales bacterium]